MAKKIKYNNHKRNKPGKGKMAKNKKKSISKETYRV